MEYKKTYSSKKKVIRKDGSGGESEDAEECP